MAPKRRVARETFEHWTFRISPTVATFSQNPRCPSWHKCSVLNLSRKSRASSFVRSWCSQGNQTTNPISIRLEPRNSRCHPSGNLLLVLRAFLGNRSPNGGMSALAPVTKSMATSSDLWDTALSIRIMNNNNSLLVFLVTHVRCDSLNCLSPG